MIPTAVITLGGMLTAAGLVLVVATLRPAAPKLSTALAQLAASPLTSYVAVESVRVAGRWGWLPTRVAAFVDAHVGVSDADLAILSMTRSQLAARKLTYGAIGLLAPSVLTVLLSLLGGQLPFVFPAALTLILAAGLWVSPSRDVKAKAQRARAQFRAALRAFLQLVAQERSARGSPVEALEEAARGWHGWPYQLIHTEVLRAELNGQPPWTALRELGTRVGMEELRSMAEIVSTAAEGAAVFDTLLAEARNLHHAEMSAQHAEANAASERLVQPLGLLAFGFVLMILIPPLIRLMSG